MERHIDKDGFPAAPKGEWDVIVIGAGVLGAFHAYFALRRGLRTLLIERGEMPGEASVRNFGTLVPSAMTPGVWLRRAMESVRIYRELANELPIPLRCDGTLYLATMPGELAVVEEFARVGPPLGYECRLLSVSESVRVNPEVDERTCLAALMFPGDARVEPTGFFGAFIPWLSRQPGCTYLPRTLVTRVTAERDACEVETSDGRTITAGHVFVCGGADLRTLFPQRLAAAGLVRCKLQMCRTAPQRSARLTTTIASGLSLRWYPSFRVCQSWQRTRDEPVDAEVTRRGIHVLMVQDADGGVVIGDSHEYSSGDLNDTLDALTESLILREARRLVRLSDWEVARRWHGIYAMHPENPIFQESIDDRIHLVTGIGGKGMTTGPAVARESIDAIC